MLIYLLLITSIPSINSESCNSFPKIFGGNEGDTHLMQIDVYNDYLAMIGYNYERSIYTDYMDYFPYILL
jgi:hypothetical protein